MRWGAVQTSISYFFYQPHHYSDFNILVSYCLIYETAMDHPGEWAKANGLSAGKLAPRRSAARAEAAIMFMCCCGQCLISMGLLSIPARSIWSGGMDGKSNFENIGLENL